MSENIQKIQASFFKCHFVGLRMLTILLCYALLVNPIHAKSAMWPFADRDGKSVSYEKECSQKTKIPDALIPELEYFLSVTDPESEIRFRPSAVKKVLDFVSSDKPGSSCYLVDKIDKATTVYHEFEFHSDLERLLKLGFNPEIPSYALTPSSVRVSYWKGGESVKKSLRGLWEYLPDIANPVIVRAVEYAENTPDLNTGAYHAYDTDRTLILMKYKSRNILIALSRQKEKSSSGKKGCVLGPDRDWNYFYSGLNGLNINGLGWINSYMYDSFNIAFYIEKNPHVPLMKCAMFKGLRAGWSNINMVKRKHIANGIVRYERDLTAILESGSLPSVEEMIQFFSAVERLSMGDLRNITKKYLRLLNDRQGNIDVVSGRKISDFIKDDSYLSHLKKEEMQTIPVLEYMKAILGRDPIIDVEKIISVGPARKKTMWERKQEKYSWRQALPVRRAN